MHSRAEEPRHASIVQVCTFLSRHLAHAQAPQLPAAELDAEPARAGGLRVGAMEPCRAGGRCAPHQIALSNANPFQHRCPAQTLGSTAARLLQSIMAGCENVGSTGFDSLLSTPRLPAVCAAEPNFSRSRPDRAWQRLAWAPACGVALSCSGGGIGDGGSTTDGGSVPYSIWRRGAARSECLSPVRAAAAATAAAAAPPTPQWR